MTIMKHRKYLFLHKDEYQRLKNQAAPTQRITISSEKDEYINSLNEKSQNWIKNWPDTVQGHILQLEIEKAKRHAIDIATVKMFEKERKYVKKNDAIQKARQMIFDDSCYGRRLHSALLESKTLEERDKQIEFQQKIKENAKKLEETYNLNGLALQKSIDMENKEKEIATRKRQKNKEIAELNKTTYLKQNTITRQEKDKQRQGELEDLNLVKKLLKKESVEEANKKYVWKKDLDLCIADRKNIEEIRNTKEKEEEHLANIWRKYKVKISDRMKMIHKKRFESHNTKNYELVNKLRNEERLRYDEFVNKGIKAVAIRQEQEESKLNSHKTKNERQNRCTIIKNVETPADTEHLAKSKVTDTCDRQCIITKCNNIHRSGAAFTQQQQSGIPILTQQDRGLVKSVRMRGNEGTSWSGLEASHAHFARQANETLKQCHNKNMARKVVDDYRRLNCLNAEALSVPNYF